VLVIVGGYLYKFDDITKGMKGTPVHLKDVQVSAVDDDDGGGGEKLLRVTTTGTLGHPKTRLYRTGCHEDITLAINTFNERRYEAVKRDMGHSRVPANEAWEKEDRKAMGLVKRKGRIEEMVRDKEEGEWERVGLLK
jgi:hypothetical protein